MQRAMLVGMVLASIECGCGGGDGGGAAGSLGSPGFTCSIGQLSGTWQIHYDEVSGGTCGAFPDEVVNQGTPQVPGCTTTLLQISADRCAADLSATCPITVSGVSGTFTWSGRLTQRSATELAGTAGLRAVTSAGNCQSVYNLTMRQL